MEAKYEEITLGETICIKLKKMYFNDTPWPKCYRQIADKLTLLKKILRKFYNVNDNVEILKMAIKYSDKDIEDVFSMESDVLKDENYTPKKYVKYGDTVQWIPVPRDKPELIKEIKELLNK
jgi:hypothetical protein